MSEKSDSEFLNEIVSQAEIVDCGLKDPRVEIDDNHYEWLVAIAEKSLQTCGSCEFWDAWGREGWGDCLRHVADCDDVLTMEINNCPADFSCNQHKPKEVKGE